MAGYLNPTAKAVQEEERTTMKSRLATLLTTVLIGSPTSAVAFDPTSFWNYVAATFVSDALARRANATFGPGAIYLGEKEDASVWAQRLGRDAEDMNRMFDEWVAPFPENQRAQEREKVRATFSELFFDHPAVQERLKILRDMNHLFDELVAPLPENLRVQEKSKLHTRFSELFLNHPSAQERLQILRDERPEIHRADSKKVEQ